MGAKLGSAAAVVTLVVTAFQMAYEATTKWTEEALDSARKLASVSGSMAAVMAERDIAQMFRDIQRGEATAGTAHDLVTAESRRKEEENRISTVIDNAKNSVLAVMNELIADILRPIADALEEITDGLFGKKDISGVGVAAFEGDIRSAAKEMDRAGRTLMDIAREAGARAGGAAPMGAAPGGRLP
jgi:hypothetical protein